MLIGFCVFKDNYGFLLQRSDKSYSDVARFVGCSPQAARDWHIKEVTPRKKTLERLAKFFNIGVAELQYGNLKESGTFQMKRGFYLPVIGLNQVDDYLKNSNGYECGFHCTFDDVSQDSFVVMQEGDSMVGSESLQSIHDGAKVIVEPNGTPSEKSVVLAKIISSNTYTLKKLVNDMGKTYLTSVSPLYGSIVVDEDIEIVGVARYAIKANSLSLKS
jgi:transcriptional regulator with XRE-family HTH domain